MKVSGWQERISKVVRSRLAVAGLMVLFAFGSWAYAESGQNAKLVGGITDEDRPNVHFVSVQGRPLIGGPPAATISTMVGRMNGSALSLPGTPEKASLGVLSDTLYELFTPVIAEAGDGSMMYAFWNVDHEGTDTIVNDVYWRGSADSGSSWTSSIHWPAYGPATCPSVDYSGMGTLFYGTFVPSSSYFHGGTICFLEFSDPVNWEEDWNLFAWDYSDSPSYWYEMKKADIA